MMEKKLHKIVLLRALLIGFWGGIIWGIFYLIMFLFNMIEIDHLALLKNWISAEWVNKWYGHIIFLFILSILSIVVAIVYYFTLKKTKSWVVGGVFGLAVLFIVYFVLPILTTGFNSFVQYELETHIAIHCLFFLYGVFVGYSISYDYEHMKHELKTEERKGEYQK